VGQPAPFGRPCGAGVVERELSRWSGQHRAERIVLTNRVAAGASAPAATTLIGNEEISYEVQTRRSIRRHRLGRWRRRALCGLLAAGVGYGLSASWAVAAAAAPGGSAEISNPEGTAPLTGGGSASLYSVVLPQGAACPGDTAHKGYLVYSYLLPKGVPLDSVSFKTGVPSQGLGFIAAGAYFGAVNTAEWTGQVPTLPDDFTWSRWSAHELLGNGTSATWQGGLACADVHGAVAASWNTEVVFSADRSDPRGYRWSVAHDPSPASRPIWLVVVGALGLVLAIVGAAGWLTRRSERGHRVRR
jgi:hypothetical protein